MRLQYEKDPRLDHRPRLFGSRGDTHRLQRTTCEWDAAQGLLCRGPAQFSKKTTKVPTILTGANELSPDVSTGWLA